MGNALSDVLLDVLSAVLSGAPKLDLSDEESAVTYDDIKRANQRLEGWSYGRICSTRPEAGFESVQGESRGRSVPGYLAGVTSSHVGIHNNEWQRPKPMLDCAGHGDRQWMEKLVNSEYIGKIDFGRNEWARARETVNEVMNLILEELTKMTSKIKGLRVNKYIKQGSSRDGLKVIAPDEFDSMLEFHFEGLVDYIKPKKVMKNGSLVPGVCYVGVSRKNMTFLQTRYPELCKLEAFIEKDDEVMLSSKYIHERVFQSLIDKANENIEKEIQQYNSVNETPSKFRINRKMNPPAINITIYLDDESQQRFMRVGSLRNTQVLTREIDLDIVPALRLQFDYDTSYRGHQLNCPIHAVCKWAKETSSKALDFVDQRLVWDVKTTGYEKHILDVARQTCRDLYILTALRIMKAYFARTKKLCKEREDLTPPQLVTVLKSYHLKQITLYLIYFLCHKYTNFRLDSTKDALYYFIKILEATLEERRLPHFFYSNNGMATQMLPGFTETTGNRLRYDLYRHLSRESLDRAKQSLYDHLLPTFGFKKLSYSFGYGDFAADHRDVEGLNCVKREFKEIMARGEFF